MEIRYVMRLAYHSQSDGKAKISNREIKKILEKILAPYWNFFSQAEKIGL